MTKIEIHSGDLTDEISAVADAYRYKPWFYVSAATDDALGGIFRNRLAKFLAMCSNQADKAAFMLARDDSGAVRGFCGVQTLDFDTKVLGVLSGRIPFCVTGPSDREHYPVSSEVADGLISAAMKWLQERGIVFTNIRADALELALIHAVEKQGFRLIDNGFTALYHKDNFKDYEQSGYEIRLFEEKDLDAVLEITRDAFLQDRFHLDPKIPHDRAEELKQIWVRHFCMEPKEEEWVIVAERKGVVKGYFEYEYNREFSDATGVGLFSYGPAAVVRDRSAIGAYYALLSWAVADSVRRGGTYAETRIPFGIQPILKLTLRLGPSFMTNDLTFHHWVE